MLSFINFCKIIVCQFSLAYACSWGSSASRFFRQPNFFCPPTLNQKVSHPEPLSYFVHVSKNVIIFLHSPATWSKVVFCEGRLIGISEDCFEALDEGFCTEFFLPPKFRTLGDHGGKFRLCPCCMILLFSQYHFGTDLLFLLLHLGWSHD